MSDLVERIRSAVANDQFVVSLHASERCEEREVTVWQLVSGLDDGDVLESRPDDTPYPSVIVEEMLPGGSVVHVVWSWMALTRRAKLVTVYFPE